MGPASITAPRRFLRERLGRITGALRAVWSPLAAEMRHLNGVGANASSRRDRVNAVKQALARRADGPNRCC